MQGPQSLYAVLTFLILTSIPSLFTCHAQEQETNSGNNPPTNAGEGVPCDAGSTFLDDAVIRTGHDGNQTPRKQSGRGTGVRPRLAGFARRFGHCDAPVNSSLFLSGDNGDLPKAANYRKLLIYLVAGAGFEPATFGL